MVDLPGRFGWLGVMVRPLSSKLSGGIWFLHLFCREVFQRAIAVGFHPPVSVLVRLSRGLSCHTHIHPLCYGSRICSWRALLNAKKFFSQLCALNYLGTARFFWPTFSSLPLTSRIFGWSIYMDFSPQWLALGNQTFLKPEGGEEGYFGGILLLASPWYYPPSIRLKGGEKGAIFFRRIGSPPLWGARVAFCACSY